MALTETGICHFGWQARDFRLKGVDGKTYSLADIRGPKGALVVFICNHCPHVRAVAREYRAQCTPDFFGFNAKDELQYRGRLDASRMSSLPRGRRELFEAMTQVAETGNGPLEQTASMGCSIKWRA